MGTDILGKGPTQYFITVRNDDSATLTEGQALEWKADGTRDGIDVQVCRTAAKLSLFVGLIPEGHSIEVGEYGMCQVYGYHGAAVIYKHGTATNADVAIGDIFSPSSGGPLTGAVAGSVLTNIAPMVVALETVASASASTIQGTCKVFLRCM